MFFTLTAMRTIRSVATPPAQLIKRISTFQPASPKIAHLEVERKFNITPRLDAELQKEVQKNKISLLGPVLDPQAAMLKFSGMRLSSITDEYFDYQDTLASQGIWIRKRTIDELPTEWEAKTRLGGDYQNSEFEEVYGEEKVMEMAKKFVPLSKLESKLEIFTERESWVAKDHFLEALVVRDFCTAPNSPARPSLPHKSPQLYVVWEHFIGEVELVRSIELTGEMEADQEKKAKVTAEMRDELKEFMLRHAKFFPTSPTPPGKVSAFLAWKKAFAL